MTAAANPIRVGVSGFLGRMGQQVVQAVEEASDMVFAGGADPALESVAEESALFKDLSELLGRARPEVVVDFSVPSAVVANARTVLSAGIACVIGTTGISPAERDELDGIARSHDTGVLIAPNFAVGAVLMMQFARQAARYFTGVEIVELHHDKKLDAPSGTALMTAGKIAEVWQPAAATGDASQAARGQDAQGIHIHSVRLPGLVAHQEVLFGNPGEALTIRHDSFDRKSFMPGVLLGVRRIRQRVGLVFGLESFLLEES